MFVSFLEGQKAPTFSLPAHRWQHGALISDAQSSLDVQAILAAYQQWGEDCAVHLSGDYAFILWDNVQKKLLAARSLTGRCLLYWSEHPAGGILFGNPHTLLKQGVSPQWDERWLALWLLHCEDHWQYSPWRAITPLWPGHSLVYQLRNGNPEIRASWFPPARLRTRELSFEVAGQAFRKCFMQAITTRLQRQEVSTFDVSGGLDSSAIVATVGYLQGQGELKQSPIEVYHGYSQEFREEDARRYVTDLVKQYPTIQPHYIDVDDLRSQPWEVTRGAYPTVQAVLMPAFPQAIERQIAAQGSEAHFSGVYGDQIFATTIRSLWHQSWWRLPGDLWELRGHRRNPLYRAWLAERRARQCQQYPAWISSEAVRLAEHCLKEQDAYLRAWLPDAFQRALVGGIIHDQQMLASVRRKRHYPYLDQGLIELLCQCPAPWLLKGNKALLREAMRDILPESIRQRQDKGNATRVIAAWSRCQSEALKALLPALPPLPFVDQEGLISSITRLGIGDSRDQRFVLNTLAFAGVERW